MSGYLLCNEVWLTAKSEEWFVWSGSNAAIRWLPMFLKSEVICKTKSGLGAPSGDKRIFLPVSMLCFPIADTGEQVILVTPVRDSAPPLLLLSFVSLLIDIIATSLILLLLSLCYLLKNLSVPHQARAPPCEARNEGK